MNCYNFKNFCQSMLKRLNLLFYNQGKVVGEMEQEEDKIKQALLKKALGYSASETVEEFSIDEEGNKKLSKKKVTKKHYSPDISAVKVLLERYYKTYEERVLSMSDDELKLEKTRLENILKGEVDGN